MRRIVIISFLAIALVLTSAFILFNKPQAPTVLAPTATLTPQNQAVDIKASFIIITGNITRTFKAEKYHNKSPDVYIESLDPTIVHVKKIGITWDDFFKTLPMKLTKVCLTTGDGETHCNKKNGTLKFYLNDIQTPDLLDRQIKDGDKALIKFSPKSK